MPGEMHVPTVRPFNRFDRLGACSELAHRPVWQVWKLSHVGGPGVVKRYASLSSHRSFTNGM